MITERDAEQRFGVASAEGPRCLGCDSDLVGPFPGKCLADCINRGRPAVPMRRNDDWEAQLRKLCAEHDDFLAVSRACWEDEQKKRAKTASDDATQLGWADAEPNWTDPFGAWTESIERQLAAIRRALPHTCDDGDECLHCWQDEQDTEAMKP